MPAYRDYKYAIIDHASAGPNVVVAHAGPAGSEIRVVNYTLVAAGTCTAQWRSNANPKSGAMTLTEGSGVSPSSGSEASLFECNAGENLVLELSAGVSVDGHVAYYYQRD